MEVKIPVDLLIQTIFTGVIGWIVKTTLDDVKRNHEEDKQWRKNLDCKVDNMNNALQANMRTNILHYCEKYLNRGWITSEELDSLTDLHSKYSMLNDHNGFINGYMERVKQLEIREI